MNPCPRELETTYILYKLFFGLSTKKLKNVEKCSENVKNFNLFAAWDVSREKEWRHIFQKHRPPALS
jgi:hypothetical protein